MYVQCTSPLRRYLDLIIQRQVYNKINNYELLSINSVSKIIDYSKNRQKENNSIFKPCSSTPVMNITSLPASLLYLAIESQIIVVYTLPK